VLVVPQPPLVILHLLVVLPPLPLFPLPLGSLPFFLLLLSPLLILLRLQPLLIPLLIVAGSSSDFDLRSSERGGKRDGQCEGPDHE
jgi:hypothetical protein